MTSLLWALHDKERPTEELLVPEYSLAAYTVKVKPRMAPSTSGNYLDLSNFDGAGSDVLQFIYAFCNSATTQAIRHKEEEKYLQVLNVHAGGRVVRATIESGSHGFASRMWDVERNRETYQRQVTDAELLPLRNMFAVPLQSATGLFITERLGIRGLKSSLVPAMLRSFSRTYPDFVLEMFPLAPEGAVKTSLEEGELKRIRLVRYGIPRDLEQRYFLGEHERELGTVEFVMKAERGLAFPMRKLSALLNSDDRAGLLEIRGLDYNDIKLEVKVGRQTRTLTLTQDKTPRITFPVPEDCECDGVGRPTDAGLYAFAMAVAQDLSQDIGLALEHLLGTGFEWTDEMRARTVEVGDIES